MCLLFEHLHMMLKEKESEKERENYEEIITDILQKRDLKPANSNTGKIKPDKTNG